MSSEALPARIHVLGASGSGTSTLAAALAARHGHRHLDTDDFYWMPTIPRFREKRPIPERLALVRRAFSESVRWALSGSLDGWGDPLVPEFELVVHLSLPAPIRMARLRAREVERYGERSLAPGGELHVAHVEFMSWAESYETAGLETRSRARHEAWLARLPCRVLRLEGDLSIAERVSQIEACCAHP